MPEKTAATRTPPPQAATAQPPGAPAPAAPAAPATGERFDIVVASFRTDAPATSVAAQIAALGLPIRRRVAEGWQQVVSGPFASRADADQAQQRLQRAGYNDTRVVRLAR